MPTVHPYRRRRSRWGFLFMTFGTLLMVTAGAVLTLWVMDVPLAFWNNSAPPNTFLVRIPINVRAIPAYSKVERGDLLDPATGWLKFQELPPSTVVGLAVDGLSTQGEQLSGRVASVRERDGQVIFVLDSGDEIPQGQTNELGGALMNVSAIIGRVVKRDKSPGLGFREDSFFPRGTPEGIAGATPPGMRSVILSADKLKGVHSLPAGARIDLLANVPLGELSSFDRGHSRLPGAPLVLSSTNSKSRNQAHSEPILLAQEALVLKPVYQRVEATTSSSLTQGKRVQAVPVYEVALAVQPGDVIPLHSALNKELEIICVTHSMQSGEVAPVAVPEHPGPLAPVTSHSILAYEVLSYDYFEDPATRRIRHEPVSETEIERLGVITSVEQLVGMVVKHDIPKGSFLTQADLLTAPQPPADGKDTDPPELESSADQNKTAQVQFISQQEADAPADEIDTPPTDTSPRNTRPRPHIVGEVPGISKFVPPGYKAVAIPWNRLYGAEHLQIGDVVDLTVTYALHYETESHEQERKPDGTVIERKVQRRANEPTQRTYEETLGFRGEPWFAALGARVIGPVGYPPPSAATRFLGDALSQVTNETSTATGPPIMFAVDEKDLQSLNTAIGTDGARFSVIIHPATGKTDVPEGWRRIVLAPQGISAFARLTAADLEEVHTRRFMTRLVRSNDPSYATALSESELRSFLGRVLARYKSRHAYFAAADFLPPGTEPGFAAAVATGSAVYVAADRDIAGLEHFQDNDRITVLYRAIAQGRGDVVSHGVSAERPVAAVVVPQARILRSSEDGQTVLEVPNADLARLQAAWASSSHEHDHGAGPDDDSPRTNLVAVLLPTKATAEPTAELTSTERSSASAESVSHEKSVESRRGPEIHDFDPHAGVRYLEAMVGSRRQVHAFPPSQPDSSTSVFGSRER